MNTLIFVAGVLVGALVILGLLWWAMNNFNPFN